MNRPGETDEVVAAGCAAAADAALIAADEAPGERAWTAQGRARLAAARERMAVRSIVVPGATGATVDAL